MVRATMVLESVDRAEMDFERRDETADLAVHGARTGRFGAADEPSGVGVGFVAALVLVHVDERDGCGW